VGKERGGNQNGRRWEKNQKNKSEDMWVAGMEKNRTKYGFEMMLEKWVGEKGEEAQNFNG